MPLYEYECRKDGRFEQIRKFSDPPLLNCPTCGQPVEKLLSSPAIQFKGSGWYITDYARKGGGSGKDGATESSKESGKDAGSSKDSAKESSKDTASSASSKTESSGAGSSPKT